MQLPGARPPMLGARRPMLGAEPMLGADPLAFSPYSRTDRPEDAGVRPRGGNSHPVARQPPANHRFDYQHS